MVNPKKDRVHHYREWHMMCLINGEVAEKMAPLYPRSFAKQCQGAKDRAPRARTQHGFFCSELQHFSKPSTLERGVPLRERKQQARWGCNHSWSCDLTIPSQFTLNLKSTQRFDWYTGCCTYLMAKTWWVFPLKSKCQMWETKSWLWKLIA